MREITKMRMCLGVTTGSSMPKHIALVARPIRSLLACRAARWSRRLDAREDRRLSASRLSRVAFSCLAMVIVLPAYLLVKELPRQRDGDHRRLACWLLRRGRWRWCWNSLCHCNRRLRCHGRWRWGGWRRAGRGRRRREVRGGQGWELPSRGFHLVEFFVLGPAGFFAASEGGQK